MALAIDADAFGEWAKAQALKVNARPVPDVSEWEAEEQGVTEELSGESLAALWLLAGLAANVGVPCAAGTADLLRFIPGGRAALESDGYFGDK